MLLYVIQHHGHSQPLPPFSQKVLQVLTGYKAVWPPGPLCILRRRNKPQRCRDSKQFCQFHQSLEFLNQESDQ
jgi:hypothetical protein